MNNIKFSDGGQPVYLDDLALLQDNLVLTTRLLLQVIAPGSDGALLEPFSIADKDWADESQATVRATFCENYICYGGMIVYVEEATFVTNMKDDMPYIAVFKTESDARTFADGQARNCRTTYEARYVRDITGAVAYYDIESRPTVLQLLSDRLKSLTT